MSFPPDAPVIAEGAAGTHFYIIVEGEVRITRRAQAGEPEQELELARRSRGDYFGELSLKTGSPTIASVTAVTACGHWLKVAQSSACPR